MPKIRVANNRSWRAAGSAARRHCLQHRVFPDDSVVSVRWVKLKLAQAGEMNKEEVLFLCLTGPRARVKVPDQQRSLTAWKKYVAWQVLAGYRVRFLLVHRAL